MITRTNLAEVLNTLNHEEIVKAYNSNKDFIKLELHTFNTGGYATMECVDYNEEDEAEVLSNGNVYVDKDNFSQLVLESTTTNQLLIAYFN